MSAVKVIHVNGGEVCPPQIKSICDLAVAYQVGEVTGDPDHPWKYGYAKEGVPPQSVLDDHVAGKVPVKVLPRPVGTQDPGRFIVVDIDNKERYKKDKGHKFLKPGQLHAIAEKIEQLLNEHGYSPLFAQSTTGSGIHFWLKFEHPQDLKAVKASLLSLFQVELGLKDGNAGIGMKQIEVLHVGGTLPGFGRHIIEEPAGGWQFSQPVEAASTKTPEGAITGEVVEGDTMQVEQAPDNVSFLKPAAEMLAKPMQNLPSLEEIEKALEFVDPDDRELWIRMGLGIKQGYGEEGFPVWDAWAKGSDKYNSAESKITWAGAS